MNDQGSLFTGRKMLEFISEVGIKLLTSTPYYAQSNGQVETTNKIVIGLIKKNIGKKAKNWHKTLDRVLWVYQTYPKEAKNITLFQLTYGREVVFHIEIYFQSV